MDRIVLLEDQNPDGPLQEMETEPYTPSEAETHIVGAIEQRIQEAEAHRAEFDREASFNLAMLRGNQFLARDTASNTVIQLAPVDSAWMQRNAMDNRLRPTARALVGKFCRIVPSCEVSPATDDDSDIRSAERATTWLEYFAKKEKLRVKYKRLMGMITWNFKAMLFLQWDPNSGKDIAYCKEPDCNYTGNKREVDQPCPTCQQKMNLEAQKQFAEETLPQFQQEDMQAKQMGLPGAPQPEVPQPGEAPPLSKVREGDIVSEVMDPRDVFPEPGVDSLDNCQYVALRFPLPISKIRQMFPESGPYIHAENDIHWDRVATLTASSQGMNANDYAYLWLWLERASVAHPDGRLIYMCNSRVLNKYMNEKGELTYGEPSPYNDLPCPFPLFAFGFEEIPGSLWSEPPTSQAWAIQRDRNRLLRQMDEQRRKTNAPALAVPIGSHLSRDDFYENLAGMVVKYNPAAGIPKYMDVPAFASYTYNELERMRLAIQDKFGVTDQEMGITSGDPSGRYAAILESQSTETLRPIIIENDEQWSAFHRAALMLAQKYYSSTRTWTVQGRDKPKSYDWGSVELSDGYDVSIVETDSLSQNPALRLQQAERLLNNGYFTDAATGMPDMGRFARMAGIREASTGPDVDTSERAFAATIPDLIAEGSYQGPQPFDDAKICAEELMNWLRGIGRQNDNPDLVAQVVQFWMLYAGAAAQTMTSPTDLKFQPNSLAQSANPAQAQTMGAGAVPGEVPTGAENIASADREAEAASTGGGPREGGTLQ